MPELSVVIPLKNEEANIVPLVAAVKAAMAGIDYELLLVDDGSDDNTCNQILDIADQLTILVELDKNYGQSAAIRAGIEHASGRFIAMLDGDLQNDPSDIPAMLALLKNGNWDVVAGNRKKRQDDFLLRKIPSSIANAIIRNLTGVRLKDYGCSLRVYKKEVALGLGLHGEFHRFIPVLVNLQGASITQIDVKHHSRQHGQSKYGLGRTFKVIRDLSLMVYLGLQQSKNKIISMAIAITGTVVMLAAGFYLSITGFVSKPVNQAKLITGLLMFAAGTTLVLLGIRAKRKARLFCEGQKNTPYKVRKVHKS